MSGKSGELRLCDFADNSEKLLSNIAQLVTKFVHDVSIDLGLSERVASEAGGRIYTSGSYRLVESRRLLM